VSTGDGGGEDACVGGGEGGVGGGRAEAEGEVIAGEESALGLEATGSEAVLCIHERKSPQTRHGFSVI
jgi:hypothetical protein